MIENGSPFNKKVSSSIGILIILIWAFILLVILFYKFQTFGNNIEYLERGIMLEQLTK